MTPDGLRTWCRDNWARVPEADRELCIAHLNGWIPQRYLQEWKVNGGFPMGLHLIGGGMHIRNKLREVLSDEKLPPVVQSNGEEARNWDDYYTGALDEMMERLP